MPLRPLFLAAFLMTGLSGCLANDTQRGLVGAAGGAAIVSVAGGSVLAGAAIGGAAGYFCRDLNVPGCENRYDR